MELGAKVVWLAAERVRSAVESHERRLVDMVDAYCEDIAFSPAQCDRLFASAHALIVLR